VLSVLSGFLAVGAGMNEFDCFERLRTQMVNDLVELADHLARVKYMRMVKEYVDACVGKWLR